MYQPSLGNRQKKLSKLHLVRRRTKFERDDLDKLLTQPFKLLSANLIYNGKTVSVFHPIQVSTPIQLLIGDERYTFKEPWQFELWITRRILLAKRRKDIYGHILPKLYALYDLFLYQGLGHKFN